MSEEKIKITDFSVINPAVPKYKSWDINGYYVPNTRGTLTDSVRHLIKILKSRRYRNLKEGFSEAADREDKEIVFMQKLLKVL